jgi:hypothetical protein
MDERQDEANASIRLRDGRYFEVIFLNPDGELVRRLDGADDVEFRDLTKVTPNDRMIALAPILDSYRLIDRIDVQNPDSEAAHQFDEIFDPDAPWGHNHHDKVLAYFAGGVTTVMRDDGRRIFHQAVWMVDDVSTESDLLVVLRHDHTVSARYTLEVNGHQTPQDVDFQGQPEQWGEIGVIIPRHLLVEGENSFRLTREREIPAVAEIFHIWVLQKIDGPGPAG